MINQSSNQTPGKRPKALAISKTFVPQSYDKSAEGFNSWTNYVKEQLHSEPVLSEKMAAYYRLFLNVKKG